MYRTPSASSVITLLPGDILITIIEPIVVRESCLDWSENDADFNFSDLEPHYGIVRLQVVMFSRKPECAGHVLSSPVLGQVRQENLLLPHLITFPIKGEFVQRWLIITVWLVSTKQDAFRCSTLPLLGLCGLLLRAKRYGHRKLCLIIMIYSDLLKVLFSDVRPLCDGAKPDNARVERERKHRPSAGALLLRHKRSIPKFIPSTLIIIFIFFSSTGQAP